jgi:hypothetical protein
MEQADTITVTVVRKHQSVAEAVDILLNIKGSALLTGNLALKQGKEIGQLLSALNPLGVPTEAVVLAGIHADPTAGVYGPSASASYQLRIHLASPELLADALAAVTSHRHVRLESLAWHHPGETKIQADALRAAVAEAVEKAGVIASALNVRLLGIHSLSESWTEIDERRGAREAAEAAGKARVAIPESGLALSNARTFELRVEARFRVSAFA